MPQNDRTALHYAVAGKNKEAVQFLLQRRIKVDQKDRVSLENTRMAEMLINLNKMPPFFVDSTVWLPYI